MAVSITTIVLLLPIFIYHFVIWIYSPGIPRLKVELTRIAQSLSHLADVRIIENSFAGTNWISCYTRGHVMVGAEPIAVYLELKYAWQGGRIPRQTWRLIVRVPNLSKFTADWDGEVAQAPEYLRLGELNNKLYPRLSSKELSFEAGYFTAKPGNLSERQSELVRQAAVCMAELARNKPLPDQERAERLRQYNPQPMYYALMKWAGSACATSTFIYITYFMLWR